jgi:Domain of unknown function (DUF1844)
MSEEKKSFTVRDRRHFTAEGQSREDEPETSTPPPVTAPHETPPAASPQDEPGQRTVGGADFAGFLVSLAAQASLTFASGEEGSAPDLSAARHFISIFEMLKDKTEGRRTPEEDQILQGILYELRMAFLASARPGGA